MGDALELLLRSANAASRHAALAFFLCVPATHLLHLFIHRRCVDSLGRLFFFPLSGGLRHTVFQLCGWALWGVSAVIALPVYMSAAEGLWQPPSPAAVQGPRTCDGAAAAPAARLQLIPATHVDAASGACATCSLWAAVFMLKALLVFDDVHLARGSLARQHSQKQVLAPRMASALVCLVGLALAFTGCVLLLALETMPDVPTRVLYCFLALSCVGIGASSTHGLGGHLRYCASAAGSAGAAMLRAGSGGGGDCVHGSRGSSARDRSDADAVDEVASRDGPGSAWHFFQPFQGGPVFVATQAIGWTLFSSTVVAVVLLARELVEGVGYCLRCWALAVGAMMMATQLMLGVSLLTYQSRRTARKLLLPVLHHPRASFARAAGLVGPVLLMYGTLNCFISVVAVLFALLPVRVVVSVLVLVLVPYFLLTGLGSPAHTGCRRWPWLCGWFTRNVEASLAWWAGGLTVVRDFEGTADDVANELDSRGPAAAERSAARAPAAGSERRKYILGLHPHGLYPTGAGFLPLMPSVQKAFPGRTIVTLTASIVHALPGLRDVAAWAGFRQVTRATFRKALREEGSVLLCPGGQAELVFADRAFPPRGSPGAAAAAAQARGRLGAAATAAVSDGPAAPQQLPMPIAVPSGGPDPLHQFVVYAGHQGFVRLALEEGAWLVPVLALGEVLQLRNLISAPELQRITYKRIGFPVPFVLTGRWGVTTLPLKNPLAYVVGRPLRPPDGWEAERQRQMAEQQHAQRGEGDAVGSQGGGGATDGLRLRQRSGNRSCSSKGAAQPPGIEARRDDHPARASAHVTVPREVVSEYHARFYHAIADLWERHRHLHPVLRHAQLVLEWGTHAPPAMGGT